MPGVHAQGQVINFVLKELPFAIEKLPLILNRLLPEDIYIHKAYLVDQEFHSRFSAKVRMYRYRLVHSVHFFSPAVPNLNRQSIVEYDQLPFIYPMRQSLDIKKYFPYLFVFLGEHDFTTFCSIKDLANNKKRHIFKIDIYGYRKNVVIDIYANGFLRSMIRSLLGNSLDCYYQNQSPNYLLGLLKAKDPSLAKKRVPAKGLCLYKVFYTDLFVKK